VATYWDLMAKLRLLNEKMGALLPDDAERAAVDKQIVEILEAVETLRAKGCNPTLKNDPNRDQN
jgi:hypothetical protein